MGRCWESLIKKIDTASEEEPMVLVIVALGGIFILTLLLGLALAFWETFGFWALPMIFVAAVIGVFLDEVFFSNKN